jgi:tetrahydromethanopterin S-methyltransferase subunit E
VKDEVEPMRNALRRRFWLETVVSIITGILFVITLILKDWIEVVFRVDPDNNNGTFEWLIVGALLVVTITLFILASYEWRRARAAIS